MIGEISGWTPERIEALLSEQSGFVGFPMLAIVAIVADIESQLAAAQERIAALESAQSWEPVQSPFHYAVHSTATDSGLSLIGSTLMVECLLNPTWRMSKAWITLPDDLRLCRRQPQETVQLSE